MLRSLFADADDIGVARYTCIANVDVVMAAAKVKTGVTPQRDIERAGGVVKCLKPFRSVVVTDCIEPECTVAVAGVTAAAVVVQERPDSEGRIVMTCRIVKERLKTMVVLLMPVVRLKSASVPLAVLPPG